MKRYNNFIVILVLLIFTLNGCCKNDIINNKDNSLELETLNYEEIKDKLIRFHVIANSDTEEDQSLKLKVRDKVVEALGANGRSVLIKNHGMFTCGKDMKAAMSAATYTEEMAVTTFYAKLLGTYEPMPEEAEAAMKALIAADQAV